MSELRAPRNIKRSEIIPTKMATNPTNEIVNCGMKVINSTNKRIYEYVGMGWREDRLATKEDYLEIPELID